MFPDDALYDCGRHRVSSHAQKVMPKTQSTGPAVMLSAVVSAALSGVHVQRLRSSGKGKAETALVYTWIL